MKWDEAVLFFMELLVAVFMLAWIISIIRQAL